MAIAAEIFGVSIVALGSFNPPIFSPEWLTRHNLVGPEDAEGAKTNDGFLISKPFTHIDTDWFDLQISEGRISISSKGVVTPAVRDLATGIFALLPHTPVTAVGLNFLAHYRIQSEDDFHKIGDTLAPKDIWKKLYPDENQSAGMSRLTITIVPAKRGVLVSPMDDSKHITIEPSGRVKQGVYFAFNDHHKIDSPEHGDSSPAELALEIINRYWQSSWDESVRICEGILQNTIGLKE